MLYYIYSDCSYLILDSNISQIQSVDRYLKNKDF